jgi:hypothetical protein
MIKWDDIRSHAKIIKLVLLIIAIGIIWMRAGSDPMIQAAPSTKHLYQSSGGGGTGPCPADYRFCDGAAPTPPLPSAADSYAFGYINFQPPTTCLGPYGGGGGGGNPNPIAPDRLPIESVRDFALGETRQEQNIVDVDEPTPIPTQSCHPYYMQQSEHPPRFAHMRRTSNSGINDYVLGSNFTARASWPQAGGWYRLDNGDPPFGMHHNERGRHVVASIQRLENQVVRAVGFYTDGRSGKLQPFVYLGDVSPIEFKPATRSPFTGHNLNAGLIYERNTLCTRCQCPSQQVSPRVFAWWGGGGNADFSLPVPSFSPIVEIWDGASSSNNNPDASGSYAIAMNYHEYYYDDLVFNCYDSCQTYTALIALGRFGVPRARRFWGRNPGDSGFVERNEHNIYYVIGRGGCNNPYYDPAGTGPWEEDPGDYKWDICTGTVPDSPCSYQSCVACDPTEHVATNTPEILVNNAEYKKSHQTSSTPTPTLKAGCCGGAYLLTSLGYRWRKTKNRAAPPPLNISVFTAQSLPTNKSTSANNVISVVDESVQAWNDAVGATGINLFAINQQPGLQHHVKIEMTTYNGLPRFIKGALWAQERTTTSTSMAVTKNYGVLDLWFVSAEYPPTNINLSCPNFEGSVTAMNDQIGYSEIYILLDRADIWDPSLSCVVFDLTPGHQTRISAFYTIVHELGHVIGFGESPKITKKSPTATPGGSGPTPTPGLVDFDPPMSNRYDAFNGVCVSPLPIPVKYESAFRCMYNQWPIAGKPTLTP